MTLGGVHRAHQAHTLAAQANLHREARREGGVLAGEEPETRRVQTLTECLNRTLQPQERLFVLHRLAGVQGVASEGAHHAQRYALGLRRLARLRVHGEDAANLEEPAALHLACGVTAQRADELRQEGVTHHAVVGRNGVGQNQAVLGLWVEGVKLSLGKEGVVHRLGQAEGEQGVAHGALGLIVCLLQGGDGGRRGHALGHGVQAIHASDLLDEVCFARQVVAPAGATEDAVLRVARDLGDAQARQDGVHLLRCHGGADHLVTTAVTQGHIDGGRVARIHVLHALARGGPAVLHEQVDGAAAGPIGQALVHAAGVTIGRLGGHAQLGGRELHARGVEEGRLQHHRAGGVLDFALFAAHHAGDRRGALGIGDDKHRLVQLPVRPVQRADGLAGLGQTHHDFPAAQRRVIKGMERVTHFHHHIVRHVHRQTQVALAALFQAARHPVRRRRVRVQSGHDARGVTWAVLRGLHAHLHILFDGLFALGEIGRRLCERTPKKRP